MITAQDILLEAKHLLALPRSTRTETRRRTIISRSYYAAYHHMCAHDIGKGYHRGADEKSGVHRAFLNYLTGIRDPDVIGAVSVLNKLYDWRIRADYRLQHALPDGTEQRCCEDAESLVLDLMPL